ncbi:MAG: flavin reductase family protein [Deltaproteobacteria bacterium]|nr:flavin reductase family protein [Deltaproteobacteria bacterium]
MKRMNPETVAERLISQISKGAFLTVKADKDLNTMTIGWAMIGIAWRRPTLMVMVRNSRYTFGIIERASDFTVSLPTTDMKEAIAFCGTKSGRDVDKYKECKLELAEAQKVTSPIIKTPGIHFECKIGFKAPMDPQFLDSEYDKLYPAKDYHTLYFGEILECYEIE